MNWVALIWFGIFLFAASFVVFNFIRQLTELTQRTEALEADHHETKMQLRDAQFRLAELKHATNVIHLNDRRVSWMGWYVLFLVGAFVAYLWLIGALS